MLLLLAGISWCLGGLPSHALGQVHASGKGKVQLLGDDSKELRSGSELSVSFPTAMVSATEIDVSAKEPPIRFEPPLKGKFTWKSQTDGSFEVETAVPGKKYLIYLSNGLRDLAGKPVVQNAPIGSRHSRPFTISAYSSEGKLGKRPSVALRFSLPVKPSDLAESGWFQDRDSRKRYPVEVILAAGEEQMVHHATVTPRTDLPGGRTYDLVIDGLKEAECGTALSSPLVEPLGETEAPKVMKVAAFNYPLHRRRIAVEFSEPVDPAEGRKIKIEPEVAVECVPREEVLWLEGDFDISQRYTVTVPAGTIGKSGFGTLAESRWGASFHPKKPALIFPTDDLHQRSQLGLRFGFIQVNTGPVQWKLARVPAEKLLAIHSRVREFTKKQFDPITGEMEDAATGLPKWIPSELLIEACRLDVVAQGTIAASPSEEDTRREINWKPQEGLPAGVYVLEVSGKNPEGKTIANRALITFTEYAAVRKDDPETCLLHVMNVGDGQSVPGVRVRAVSLDNKTLGESVTDASGMARFQRDAIFGGNPERKCFLIQTPSGPMIHPIDIPAFCESGYASDSGSQDNTARVLIASDRPLYRPGQVLHFKGFVRAMDKNRELKIPHDRKVTWKILTSQDSDSESEEEMVANGDAKLDDYGGFEGEWTVPKTIRVANYQLMAFSASTSGRQLFSVQEFRPPPFLVTLANLNPTGAQAGIRVSSVYFHGAPNAGARVQWKAIWRGLSNGDPTVVVADKPREASAQWDRTKTVTGEGVLSNEGCLDLFSTPPFTDGIPRGWYEVDFSADVTAQDGQTISESFQVPVFAVPVKLSVDGVQKKASRADRTFLVSLKATATGTNDKLVQDRPISVEIYRVINKTAKEQISPSVYRYHNSTLFQKEESFSGKTPLDKELKLKHAGEYLAVARDSSESNVPAVANRVYIAGQEDGDDAQFPLRDEESIGVTCDKPYEDPKNGYLPGETAILSVQSPFSGMAWVSVEAESVIETFVLPLESNSGRIELPIKKEFGPNARVSVYLLHPGGNDQLPAERCGSVRIRVRRPDLELAVKPEFAAKQVQPKATVSGQILVTCQERPVPDADVTLYAVDEAVLDAGDWHEPPLMPAMYPERFWKVSTYHGLERLSCGVDSASLHQKGFIIGDMVGKGASANINVKDLRTDFPPLAFWKTHLRTDRNGKVPFSFKAPDGLTKYRVIALAQTKQAQFGTGSDWVEISKPFQIEPSLPRFLRVGDQVELRAVVRQKIADELPVKLRCSTGLALANGNVQTQTVRRNVPAIFRFRASVEEMGTASVRFDSESGSGDAVEIVVPVEPPTLIRKEAIFGNLSEVRQRIPEDWTHSTGSTEMTLSTSPWLPKLTGLPRLLEYPHGCFEQVTSRTLGYTVLNDLLAFLPQPSSREQAYAKRIESGLNRMDSGLTSEGFLPYWPGEKGCALPTIAGYWAVSKAANQGLKVSSNLKGKLTAAVRGIALGKSSSFSSDSFARSFALMALSECGGLNKEFGGAIREMYLRRENFSDESRALLAIAMHRLGNMQEEKQQLLKEIDVPLKERGFDPGTFSSTTRAEAIRAVAFAIASPEGNSGIARNQMQARIESLLETSQSLSTQENFWLLFAFKSMHPALQSSAGAFRGARPAPAAISRNGASALWSGLAMKSLKEFAVRLNQSEDFKCLMEAQFRTDSAETNRTDNGMRVERVVKNLTDPARTGSEQNPFRLGDQILISYRLVSPKLHHFVALEDELPGGLETINPNLASIAHTYSVPQEKGTCQLNLSFSELRDHISCLYFDRVESGVASYSVLARATCAGVFRWPATQALPMYDSRFSGLSPSSLCYVSGE